MSAQQDLEVDLLKLLGGVPCECQLRIRRAPARSVSA